MRTFSKDVFSQGIHDLLKINDFPALSSDDGSFTCKFKIELIQKNDPWPRNEKTDHLISIWKQAAETLGITIIREERGGLSDGNQLWDFTPTIDGLGPNGMNAHCSERSADGSKDQEYVVRSSFPIKAVLNTIAIQKLLQES
jgi:glutamate carboxypeptidase